MTITLASCKEPHNWRGKTFCTSVGPMWGNHERLEFLAPDRKIVNAHQQGKITNKQYMYGYDEVRRGEKVHIRGYREILQSRWPEVNKWLISLDPETDITLLCFCTEFEPGTQKLKFCHRDYIGKMINVYRPEIVVVRH